ncbi:Gti1/Pac2 family-domain-containing protein [Zopfochytrium polystomum]|nr:Gti1/Pac2 family-domain-containing protein [Zopfochytrium polystomum]
MRELEKVPNSVASSNDGPVGIETFYGFISTPLDALMVVEGCRLGLLHTLDVRPREISDIVIRSGSVIVFDEAGSRMRRWRDNRKWSPSRVAGPFLLYKEIDTADSQRKSIAQMPTKCIPGVDPVFGAGVLRGDCRILDDGLTKKTMSVVMDDGKKYRVISYYLRSDVIEGRLVVPSKSPMLASIDPNSERLLNLLPLESRPQLGDSALPVGQAPHTKLDSEGPLPIGKRKQVC